MSGMAAESEWWSGAYDARGRPHGRGTLWLGKRSRYEGRLRHGRRRGRGTLFVDEASGSDEEGDDEQLSMLRVTWLRDAPNGPGVFTEPGGGELHGTWDDGALQGPVREFHASGTLRCPPNAARHWASSSR